MVRLFDEARLLALAAERAAAFRAAAPFPHAVIDGAADPAALERVAEAFPGPERAGWYRYENELERKLAMPHVERLPEVFRDAFAELNSGAFLRFLEALAGIEGLVADPELNGGGLHQVLPGGKLDVHVDHNRHPRTGLDRRLNAILYLNRDWPDAYGGHLELWDRDMTGPVRRIAPVFNRLVVFATTEESNHGHPEPVACPEGRSRRSLAVYYYTAGRPEPERAPAHSTVFKRRPQDAASAALDELRSRRAKGRLADLVTKSQD